MLIPLERCLFSIFELTEPPNFFQRDDSEALAAGFKKFLASLPDEGPKSKDNVLRFLKTVPEESEESKRITEGALLHFQAAKRRHTKSGTGAFDAAGALKEALLSLKGSK